MSKDSSLDIKVLGADDTANPKDVLAQQPAASSSHRQQRRRGWVYAAAGAGLLLLGLGIGLAIGLPLAFKQRGRGGDSVQLSTGGAYADAQNLKGATRTYYLAAEPITWDYLPSGKNLCSGQPFVEEAELYVSKGIGTKFKKAVYRQYKDDSFQERTPRTAAEQHMGLLGPALHAEVGDTLVVVLRNNLDFPINLLAGGVALPGGAPRINPGDTVTARWYIPASAGPAPGGPSTQLWLYRSAVDPTRDTQAGLAGPLVVGRPGSLNDQGKPADVDKEHFLMLQVFDESKSPFFESNSATAKAALAELSEDDGKEANMKYSINGFLFCNTPGLNSTVGDRVRWYVSSLGSEDAIHTAHWHGISFNMSGKHMDQVVIQSSTAAVLDAYNDNPGTWLFHCHLTDHIHGGMMALFNVAGKAPVLKLDGKNREYFIAAEEEVWDYAPFGGEMCGGSLVNFSDNAKTFVEAGPDRVGRKYIKARYVEYTDASFTQKKRRAAAWEHLGVLGPVIRGAVGDTLKIHFKNNLKEQAVSIHPHGVWYDKDSEGSPYVDGLPVSAGDSVAPGKSVTYTWLVPERAGPGAADLGSVMWMYHSHVNEAADPYAGLLGPIIITSPGNAKDDGSPRDVDREYVLSFAIMDEAKSFLAERNILRALPQLARNKSAVPALLEDEKFKESSLKHSINGYLYCNLPGLEFVQGSSARLYFMAIGSKADMHTPNSAESQLFLDGHKRQAVSLLPGAMLTVDTIPMVSGRGLLQCHVYDHISAGMSALYQVKNLGILEAPADAPVRTYYIAAEPVMWDYAPLGFDGCSGNPWSEEQLTFVKTTNATLGSQYKKGLFREYTDATFKTPKPSPPEHGILGPIIRAEVGDKVVVVFKNKLLFNASVQMFGGLAPLGDTSPYQVNLKSSSSPSKQQSSGRRLLARHWGRRHLQQISASQAEAEAVIAQSVENLYALGGVAPGGSMRYEWFVPDSAGPASRDGPVVVYTYVSGVDHIKHISAGLVGPVAIYSKGKLNDPGVDIEVPLFFNIQNEMQSVYFKDNLELQQNKTKLVIDTASSKFPESNLMHSINGYIHCNGPTLQLSKGQRVRWLVMGFGSEQDMHSPVFDGQAVEWAGEPVYSVGLMPSNTFALHMSANSTGSWDYYCNVLDHITAGMKARMVVS